MDKPIMIDGVDVSECKKLDREYAPNYPEIGGYDWFNECKETSTDCQGRNCLFKQLARKTQECEKIKNWVKSKMFYTDCVNWFERFVYAFDDWQTDLQKQIDQLKAAKEQSEQKLEKIKDRCKETLELMDKDSGTNAYAGGRCTEAGQILQIIEVE